ncbi:hypothetical protein Prum_068560 [Phytohabitans rumicis]|uniref:Na(+)/H(+) antiporter NhaA n=1 Tax=Phytohabitans rumicis TaxID=1076125 RepID=A0A6V8LA44_9ACTN|nr:hypothetical protein Prum_068560 [Phytohabitans rumicis]
MPRRSFSRSRLAAARRVAGRLDALTEYLRQETSGGKLLLAATAAALLWANLAGGSYKALWQTEVAVGPGWLHLDLPLAGWVADGLLAIFFFVAGLEVKRELTVGELAGWRAAALPLAAAAGGMILPAGIALLASRGAAAEGGAWAIPVATDIAFALGVLALAGSALPSGVRVLLLSMAVIDDLGAITLIAVLFTHHLSLAWLAGAAVLCAAYWWAQRHRSPAWLLVPVAVAVWVCVHASGVHATVAGIALGLLTPYDPGPVRSRLPVGGWSGGCTHCRQGSWCPCSRSPPPGSHWARSRRRSPTRSPTASSPACWLAKRSASWAGRGWPYGPGSEPFRTGSAGPTCCR